MIELRNGNLLIEAATAQTTFGDDPQVSVVYYPDRRALLIAGKSKTFFEKMHKTQWVMLKARNAQGDKTLNIRDILIDHDLDDTDRTLPFDVKSTGILSVTL